MQRTAAELFIRVGDDKTPIKLTDAAVEAVQEEAAGKLVDAFATIWEAHSEIEPGEGFASLDLDQLIGLRQALGLACDLADVLIECRPLDEAEGHDDA